MCEPFRIYESGCYFDVCKAVAWNKREEPPPPSTTTMRNERILLNVSVPAKHQLTLYFSGYTPQPLPGMTNPKIEHTHAQRWGQSATIGESSVAAIWAAKETCKSCDEILHGQTKHPFLLKAFSVERTFVHGCLNPVTNSFCHRACDLSCVVVRAIWNHLTVENETNKSRRRRKCRASRGSFPRVSSARPRRRHDAISALSRKIASKG